MLAGSSTRVEPVGRELDALVGEDVVALLVAVAQVLVGGVVAL